MGHDSDHRHKSADGKHRNIQLNIRLSAGEKARLLSLSKAANLSMSDYVLRRTIYDDQPIYIVDTVLLASLSRELAYQGNNLNQATHALNAAIAAPFSPRFEGYLDDGIQSVLVQEASRLALYNKLDCALADLLSMKLTKRSL